MHLITLAGVPAATVNDGMLLTTTELAAIIAPEPIVTPGKIITPSHIHTLSPIMTSPLEKRVRS
ncbi:hypothetical protein GFJ13_06540 [Escherichia coli]|nr:hypothetical protein [Escherichia coli]EFH9170794.1 hypothetical protein [Escherichia coli]HAH0171893.1 hypothetical protein [Escherichia coli]HAH3121696.1 hypothetical protein [Escherichia coli]HAH3823958.1 hypothetical protein [Escherichia coli]